MLIGTFITASLPQVSRSHVIGFTYELTKRSTVTRVELRINSCANIFGASYESDVLHNNRLKKITPSAFYLRPHIPLSSAVIVKTNIFPDQSDGTL